MNILKKIFIAVICVILCIPILSACNADPKAKAIREYEKLLSRENPVSLRIQYYYSSAVDKEFQGLIDNFNKTVGAEKGINIFGETSSGPSDLFKEIQDTINGAPAAKLMPDIVQCYTDIAYYINKNKGLAAIDKYFLNSELDEFTPSYLNEGRMGDGNALRILPIAKSSEVMVINKKAWEAFAAAENAGGNTVTLSDLDTIEGLNEVAGLFYNRYGKAFYGRDAFSNYMIIGLKQLGYDIFNPAADGSLNVCTDKAAYRTLWDNMYIPVASGFAKASDKYHSNIMQSEDVIAYIGSTSSTANIPQNISNAQGTPVTGNTGYANEVIIKSTPYFKNGSKVNIQQGAGMSIVKSDERREYASAVFLKWLTENSRNVEFSVSTGYFPVKKAFGDYQTLINSPEFAVAMVKFEQYNITKTEEEVNIKKANLHATLQVYSDMLKEYTFQFTPGVENATTIRDNYLANASGKYDESAPFPGNISLQYKAGSDAIKVRGGEVALADLKTDANFNNWYDDFVDALNDLLNN